MDTITHTLLGLTTYGAVKKEEQDKQTKRALLFSAVAGAQIPDIDVVANLTETGRVMEQMWHRGLTHSIFLTPFWALLIYAVALLIWKRKDRLIFYLAWLNVVIHISVDSLNNWGTGLLEPISSMRVSLGFIPIVDLVFWGFILSGFIVTKAVKRFSSYRVWRWVLVCMALHVAVQSVQGMIIKQEAQQTYEEVALAASFVPWHFSVIAKSDEIVNIYHTTVWRESVLVEALYSDEDADLDPLFSGNPKAPVLMEWSPFVVVVEEDDMLAIFDPRFYRNGSSFLTESVELNQ
ncbi:metal-dependent hydrolase [Halalkalibacter urbisdiaboli]|uniref:metal-dependent hydrolase n=1 Tax=Halalkalibacter urbisdiaboli TaxID=1960589 RepID=UPI000B430CB7|nr:metal-dependent hydrolase [Halalkalibacter urbisdiaboli]